ncbi:hypothetical protein PG985_005673 [Apiospora marii]|uniref:uncharacterized protein n=1 Tax=Apiospora marii TaxID=335849 RepID=UPI003130F02C
MLCKPKAVTTAIRYLTPPRRGHRLDDGICFPCHAVTGSAVSAGLPGNMDRPSLESQIVPTRLMLGEKHDAHDYSTSYDGITYTCSTTTSYNIVMTSCALTTHGVTSNVNVSHAAGSMFNTFANVRMALLSIIGGGIPRAWGAIVNCRMLDLKYGDVVISWPGNGKPACGIWWFGRRQTGRN